MTTNLNPRIARDMLKPKAKRPGESEKALKRSVTHDDRTDDDRPASGEDIVKRAAERNDRKGR